MLHSLSRPPPIAAAVFGGTRFSGAAGGDTLFPPLPGISRRLDVAPAPAGPLNTTASASLHGATTYFSLLDGGSPKSMGGRGPNWLDRHNLAASECQEAPVLEG